MPTVKLTLNQKVILLYVLSPISVSVLAWLGAIYSVYLRCCTPSPITELTSRSSTMFQGFFPRYNLYYRRSGPCHLELNNHISLKVKRVVEFWTYKSYLLYYVYGCVSTQSYWHQDLRLDWSQPCLNLRNVVRLLCIYLCPNYLKRIYIARITCRDPSYACYTIGKLRTANYSHWYPIRHGTLLLRGLFDYIRRLRCRRIRGELLIKRA